MDTDNLLKMLKSEYQVGHLSYYDFQSLATYYLYSEEDVKTFYENNKQKITDDVFNAIKYLLKEYLLEVPVFNINVGNQLIKFSVTRNKVNELLQECIKNYIEVEDYEKCAEATKIINKDKF